MSDSTSAGGGEPTKPSPTDLQTRFVVIKANPVDTLLPYIQAVIDTIGSGSAIVVRASESSDSGLQLTLPLKAMDFVIETIRTYEGTSQTHPTPVLLSDYPLNVVYPPLIKVGAKADSLKVAIDQLGICPPDIHVAVIILNSAGSGALIVSGPEKRKDSYTANILPVLQKIATEIATSPGA